MSKAATKAEKIRRKRGRFRIENVPREPNGRISRSGIDHGPADVVALEARRRIWGLTEKEAKDQKAGTVIGRLNLLGREDGLSNSQYDAAIQYIELRAAYLRAISAPGRMTDGDAGSGSSHTDEYEQWVRDTVEAYEKCRKAIQEAQNENRHANLWAALDLCVIHDQDLPHMVGDLRLLCNALARFFRT